VNDAESPSTVVAPQVQAAPGRMAGLTMRELKGFLLTGLLLLAAGFIPLLGGDYSGYVLSISISIAIYTALATSWMLFSGPTNYISLATGAFFGLGMYVVAAGIDLLPYSVLILLAAIAGAVLAGIVGLATLRISGVYFVIFSLGLSELVRQIVTWLQHVLGTMSGLYVLTDRSEEMFFWQLLALVAVVYLIGWWIGRSRLGFALRIIGNDEVVAVHCGINTALAKVALFVISGTVAAVAGALVAPRWSYVEPNGAFSPFLSFQVVIMALLGGVHRLWGPLVGVIPFTLLWELINQSYPRLSTLLLGVCFLLIVYFIPRGVVGLIEDFPRARAELTAVVRNLRALARRRWKRGNA
jgi:branched-chain amino acid transport system permease protein